jgi:hypothetical protein
MTTIPVSDDSRPYALAAATYVAAGWEAPLPVDVGHGDAPVPTGYTGGKNASNYPPSGEQVARWCLTHAGSNLGLWLPPNVIGVDVDSYGDKTGHLTIEHVAQQVAREPLPATWTSTARGPDQPSRIHFFRVPDEFRDVKWLTGLTRYGGAVDVIRFGHMFARVWPSRKLDRGPLGELYRWYRPNGLAVPQGVVPHVTELTELPAAWVAALSTTPRASSPHLTGTGTGVIGYGPTLDVDTVIAWVSRLRDADAEPCLRLAELSQRAADELRGPVSRHDTVKSAVWSLLLSAVEDGHRGVKTAVDLVGETFFDVVVRGDGSRTQRVAEGEWTRLIVGAVSRIAATYPGGTSVVGCRCDTYLGVASRLLGRSSGSNDVTKHGVSRRRSASLAVAPGDVKKIGHVTLGGRVSRNGGAK